jgi:hypothetical protein
LQRFTSRSATGISENQACVMPATDKPKQLGYFGDVDVTAVAGQ